MERRRPSDRRQGCWFERLWRRAALLSVPLLRIAVTFWRSLLGILIDPLVSRSVLCEGVKDRP